MAEQNHPNLMQCGVSLCLERRCGLAEEANRRHKREFGARSINAI